MQTLSVARGLGLNGLNTLNQMAELRAKSEQASKRALKLERALEVANVDLKKARDEVEMARDEVEEAKLELLQSWSSFEEELVKAWAQAIEEFKQFNEFKTLLGQYRSGSYYYGL